MQLVGLLQKPFQVLQKKRLQSSSMKRFICTMVHPKRSLQMGERICGAESSRRISRRLGRITREQVLTILERMVKSRDSMVLWEGCYPSICLGSHSEYGNCISIKLYLPVMFVRVEHRRHLRSILSMDNSHSSLVI